MLLHGITFNKKRNKKLYGYSFDSLGSIAYQQVIFVTKNGSRPLTATSTKKPSSVGDEDMKPLKVNPSNDCDINKNKPNKKQESKKRRTCLKKKTVGHHNRMEEYLNDYKMLIAHQDGFKLLKTSTCYQTNSPQMLADKNYPTKSPIISELRQFNNGSQPTKKQWKHLQSILEKPWVLFSDKVPKGLFVLNVGKGYYKRTKEEQLTKLKSQKYDFRSYIRMLNNCSTITSQNLFYCVLNVSHHSYIRFFYIGKPIKHIEKQAIKEQIDKFIKSNYEAYAQTFHKGTVEMNKHLLIVNFNGSVSVINSLMTQLEPIDHKTAHERIVMKQEQDEELRQQINRLRSICIQQLNLNITITNCLFAKHQQIETEQPQSIYS